MKRLLQTMFLVLATQVVFAQGPCQAAFTANYDSLSLLYLYDASFNTDSTPITVTTYDWSVQYNGINYTFNTANPVAQVGSYGGQVWVCLTITTNTGCTSTYCDYIYLNSPPQNGCTAGFSYQVTPSTHFCSFTDLSVSGNPGATVNAWSWTITKDSLTIFTSNIQDPTFTFPVAGTYIVCLNIATDSGCTSNYCEGIIISDSMQNNCQLNVYPVVSNVTVIGGNDGYIDLTVSGGTPPYTYDWNNGTYTTEDISGLSPGLYTVIIGQNNINCPPVTYTFQIIQPYDTTVIDTLFTFPIDTCLNFQIDSFYISNISINGNIVNVTWIFVGGGQTGTFTVTYTFGNYGTYIVALTLNCAKSSVTYMSYINITSTAGIADNQIQEMLLYPNPTRGVFKLYLPGSPGKDIRIFNSMGQLMYSGKTLTESTSIDASRWSAGVYLIRVDNGNNRMIVRNIIKQ